MRRRRRKKIKDAPGRALLNSKLWRNAVFVAMIALCAAALVTLVIHSYQGYRLSGPHRAVYEGRIVDKSFTVTESYQGSGAILRLHIRDRDGVVFDVIVPPDLYERARVGMWIRKDGNGPELYATEPTPADGPARAETKTEGAETPPVSAPQR